MKTYDEIVHELFLSKLAQTHMMQISEVEEHVGNFGFVSYSIDLQRQAAKIYAQQVAEDVRQKCANNAKTYDDEHRGRQTTYVDIKSIIETEIILP